MNTLKQSLLFIDILVVTELIFGIYNLLTLLKWALLYLFDYS